MPRTPLTLSALFVACLLTSPAFAQTPDSIPASSSFLDDLFGRFLPRLGYSYDTAETVGREGGLSAFQAFLPVWEDRAAAGLVFSDSRVLLFDHKGTIGANLGLGGRMFSDYLGRTVGGYVYWDYSDTGRASFNQVSGGVETLGDLVDARANFYVPVGKDRKTTDQVYTANGPEPYFQGNALLVGGGQGWRSIEQALYGFDTEAGLRFFANDSLELRAFAGMYHYAADQVSQAWGPRGRLEARVRDTLAMGLSVQNDRLFGTTVNLNVLVTFPRLSGRGYGDGPAAPLVANDRLGDPVVRAQHVAVYRQQERYLVPGKAVVDPLTGQPYLFLHVAPGGNSDGSVENPYGSLAAAFADTRFIKGNVVVYDRTQGTFAGNVRFAPGTRLLASGPVQVLETIDGGQVRVPYSGTSPNLAQAPRIQGTVTLASQSAVSGFDIRAAGGSAAIAGLEGSALRNLVVVANRISGGSVQLPNVAGLVVVRQNQLDSPNGGGILLGVQGNQTATLRVRDNRISQPAGDGIRVVASGTSVTSADVSSNTVERAASSATAAIVLDARGNPGSSLLRATVADNHLPGNAAPGVTVRAGGTNTLDLDLFGNEALSRRSMFGFLLQQHGESTFHVVGPETLGARNVGSIVTTGTITPGGSAQ